MPSFYHGQVCSRINRRLGNFIEEQRLGSLTSHGSGVVVARNPDTVHGPNLAFWSRETLPNPPRQGYPAVPPDLAVEVLSPSDVFTRVQLKVQEYLNAGVRMVWIVVPEDRSIAVFRPGQLPRVLANGATVSGEEVLPGFCCEVGELFP